MDNRFYSSFRSGLVTKFKSRTAFNLETEKMVGCTCDQFVRYINRRMHPSMNAANMGTVWTIGYILTEDEAGSRKRRIHYKNFYPLFKQNPRQVKSNIVVSDKIHKKRYKKALLKQLKISEKDIYVAIILDLNKHPL